MGSETGISWTDSTWGPVRGCDDVSPGCLNCYAKGIAARFSGPGLAYEGLGKFVDAQVNGKRRRLAKWSGAGARLIPELLDLPLRWRRPRRIFVNSTSDLFHESISNEEIAAVFGVMAAAPRHTFQVLTKRPERMRAWFRWNDQQTERGPDHERLSQLAAPIHHAQKLCGHPALRTLDAFPWQWPLANVWLGVTAEDQQRANERIPILLGTPAPVRWVSVEPQVGAVDLSRYMWPVHPRWPSKFPSPEAARAAGAEVTMHRQALIGAGSVFLDWVVQGGESGPDARPFDLAWMRDLRDQCARAGVAYFAKQLGAKPYESVSAASRGAGGIGIELQDGAGADPSEWPKDLRARAFPEVRA